ncbi:MAG TPA: DNA helicase UvrD, partial [Actinobacteria bacterium]|nr:DNA helicase UvrD [Actinomycetota bacterium]
IYAFRGADVGGLLSFPVMFRDARGAPAPVVVLRTARRYGPRIRAAAGSVLGSRIPAGLSAERWREHRSPACAAVADPEQDDRVDLATYTDPGSQAAHVAHQLRQAHVRRGVA